MEDYGIDEDYIGVESKRADISPRSSDDEERDADLPPSYDELGADRTYLYLNDGSGAAGTSWDKTIDEEAPQEHDGRALTRTGFDPREAAGAMSRTVTREGKRMSYARWLSTLNDGYRSSVYTMDSDKAMVRRMTATFASSLGLAKSQRATLEDVMGDLELDHLAHYSAEIVILAAISLIANADDRWIRDEERFKRMVHDVGYKMGDVKNCRLLIKRKTDLL